MLSIERKRSCNFDAESKRKRVLFRQQLKRLAFNEPDRGRINLLTYPCP